MYHLIALFNISITYSELRRLVTDEVAATYWIRCLTRGATPINKENTKRRFPRESAFFLKGRYLI